MQINSVQYGVNYGSMSKNASFGNKVSSLDIKKTGAQDILAKRIDEIKSNVNRITFENAVDFRMRIAKEIKGQLDSLKKLAIRAK